MAVDIMGSDYKAILHSKRANIYYLEKCRVLQKDGRVVYLTESKQENLYWNIPIANTTVILLGMGTSITQSAMRLLASAGVLVGFCGSGGTPLFSGAEVEWLLPQSEYRPTEYVQQWLSFWFSEEKRLAVAKYFQLERCEFIRRVWIKDDDVAKFNLHIDDFEIDSALVQYEKKVQQANSVMKLLTEEARFTKALYKYIAQTLDIDFARDRNGTDDANVFLNHGNYLAYGLGACTLWVLGIPHGFAVMHGKTRRGALVFDVADLVKDAIVLPQAFMCAADKFTEQEFRGHCLQKFVEHKALDYMFDVVKNACRTYGEGERL